MPKRFPWGAAGECRASSSSAVETLQEAQNSVHAGRSGMPSADTSPSDLAGGNRSSRKGQRRVDPRRVLRAFGPAMPRPKSAEAVRAAIGAGLALALCGAILAGVDAWFANAQGLFLIAPLGATTFLIFAVPNSPLAQPWPAIVGNVVSAAVAISVLRLGLPTELAAGLAVCGAMAAMALLRAMHPPGAAVALAMVLSAPVAGGFGYGFVFAPVLLDTVFLIAFATLYNRATGRVYPFRQPAASGRHATTDLAPERRLGLSPDDLSTVLDRFNLSANIGPEDFGRILAAAQAEAARRHFDDLTCGELMSRDIVSVAPEARLGSIADLFRRHRFKTVPVVDEDRRLCGIVTQNDLIQRARLDTLSRGARFAAAMTRLASAAGGGHLLARDIMTSDLRTVRPDDGIDVLVRLLADGGVQAAPVMQGDRLVGIITRSDLIAMLSRQTLLAGRSQRAA